MKPTETFHMLALSALCVASGCSTTNDIRVEEGITTAQRQAALALAEEFGIKKIHSIYTPFNNTFAHYLTVRGDDQLKGDIGRHKKLRIRIEEETFEYDPPRNITPTLDDCSMSIVEFVELEVESGKRRVFTGNVNPKLALRLLTKIYNSDFTLAPGVDAEECLSRVLIHSPAFLNRAVGYESVFYELTANTSHTIKFKVEEDKIVIQQYIYDRVIF